MLKNNIKSNIVGAYGHTPLKFVMIAMLTIGVITVTGCKKEEAGPAKVEPTKKAVAPVQAVMTSVIKAEVFYDPAGKRDPFKSFMGAAGTKARPSAPATPLQSHDLSALKLVGVMALPGKKVAIIEDPSGKGYHVKMGTRIGLNEGVVVDILSDELIVEETYLDEISQSKVRRVSVKIPKEQGQGGEGR